MTKPAPTLRRKSRLVLLAALVLLLTAAALTGLARLWIGSDHGRAFIVSQLDGIDLGQPGYLRIDRIEGDPLARMAVSGLSLSDDQGPWLEADTIHLSWSPAALFSGTLHLLHLYADEIRILRRPQTRAAGGGSGGRDMRFLLDDAGIGRLILSEGVAGPGSVLTVSARLSDEPIVGLTAALQISPVEGTGDMVDLDLIYRPGGAFNADLVAEAPSGGVFANLIGLEEGSSATLRLQAAGDMINASGDLRLMIDEAERASIVGEIKDRTLTAAARLDASDLKLSGSSGPLLAGFIGSNGFAKLVARPAREGTAFAMEISVLNGDIALSGLVDLPEAALVGPAHLSVDLASLAPLDLPEAGLRLDGALSVDGGDAAWSGEVHLIPAEGSSLPLKAARGLVEAAWSQDMASLKGSLDLAGLRIAPIHDAAGPGQLEFDAALAPRENRITLRETRLAHSTGELGIHGLIDLRAGDLDLTGTMIQRLPSLAEPVSGSAEGSFLLSGPFGQPGLEANLRLRRLKGPPALADLLDGEGRAEMHLQFGPDLIDARKLTLQLAGLDIDASGILQSPGGTDLILDINRTGPLQLGGTEIGPVTASARIVSDAGGLQLSMDGEAGHVRSGPVLLTDIRIQGELGGSTGEFEAPVRVLADLAGEPAEITALAWRRGDVWGIDPISGTAGAVNLSGSVLPDPAGGMKAVLSLDGEAVAYSGFGARRISLTAHAGLSPSTPARINVRGEAAGASLAPGREIDHIGIRLEGDAASLDYAAEIRHGSGRLETGLTLEGGAGLTGPAPEGWLRVAGGLLGQPVSSLEDSRWRLGESPFLHADLALLGGSLEADVEMDAGQALLSFAARNIDPGPGLELLGVKLAQSRLNADGRISAFGAAPEGNLTASFLAPDPALDLSLSARLEPAALRLDAGLLAGGPSGLSGKLELALPVSSAPGQWASLPRDADIDGQASLSGELAALREVALAFGHDLGGHIDTQMRFHGSLSAPALSGRTELRDGIYEYGQLGMRLEAITGTVSHSNTAISLDAEARDRSGGRLKASGSLSGEENARLALEFNRLAVYNRNNDRIRLSGTAGLSETATARIISGKLQIDEGRFSLDNLPQAGVRRLAIRWRETGDTPPAREELLEKPILLDLSLNAARRLFVTGRGLDSEWSLAMNVSGSPEKPLLKGRANLLRGSLELARRPFIFETGTLSLDGAPSTARVEIRGEHEADGLKARVELVGPVSAPDIRLSSTPTMPEDEILAHILFGRSALDLTAIEAAELAASIARLSGQAGGIDPLGRVQSGLGLDRLRFGPGPAGQAELGLGRYLTPEVYLEVNAASDAGNSALIDWQPRPGISVKSETSATGQSKISLQWKKDY